MVNARLTGYTGIAASSKSYTGTKTCQPGNMVSSESFDFGAWLAAPSRGLLSRDTTLTGNINLGGDTFSWNLGAQ